MTKLLLRTCAAVALVALAIGLAGAAQDDWSKKPFNKWTKAEAEKVLNDSPWARPQAVKIRGLLDCPACADNYVLTLSAKSGEAPGADPVFTTFKGARLADLQRYVYIADERGQRRTLVHFVPPKAPGEEATFFFPRADDKGSPLLTTASKEFYFNLSDMEVNSVTNFRVDVTKLVAGGAVDF